MFWRHYSGDITGDIMIKNNLFKKIPAYEAWIVIIALMICFPLLGAHALVWKEEGVTWTLIPIMLNAVASIFWLISVILDKNFLRKAVFILLLFNCLISAGIIL
jgi:hypothetical protein